MVHYHDQKPFGTCAAVAGNWQPSDHLRLSCVTGKKCTQMDFCARCLGSCWWNTSVWWNVWLVQAQHVDTLHEVSFTGQMGILSSSLLSNQITVSHKGHVIVVIEVIINVETYGLCRKIPYRDDGLSSFWCQKLIFLIRYRIRTEVKSGMKMLTFHLKMSLILGGMCGAVFGRWTGYFDFRCELLLFALWWAGYLSRLHPASCRMVAVIGFNPLPRPCLGKSDRDFFFFLEHESQNI